MQWFDVSDGELKIRFILTGPFYLEFQQNIIMDIIAVDKE